MLEFHLRLLVSYTKPSPPCRCHLQFWKPNNLESLTFSSIGSNLLKVCYSILWLYSRCNFGIMNLETHCSIQTNPFCMSLFKLIFHTSYPLIKINFTLIMITTRVSLMMMTMDFIWCTEAPSLTVATRDQTTSVFTTCLTLAMDHWGMAPSLSLKLTSLLQSASIAHSHRLSFTNNIHFVGRKTINSKDLISYYLWHVVWFNMLFIFWFMIWCVECYEILICCIHCDERD